MKTGGTRNCRILVQSEQLSNPISRDSRESFSQTYHSESEVNDENDNEGDVPVVSCTSGGDRDVSEEGSGAGIDELGKEQPAASGWLRLAGGRCSSTDLHLRWKLAEESHKTGEIASGRLKEPAYEKTKETKLSLSEDAE